MVSTSDTCKMTEDSPGVVSAKRRMGVVTLAVGIAILVAVAVVSMFHRLADPATSMGCGRDLIIVGGSLLGVCVFEGIGQAIGKRFGGGQE
jgi:hypothetical protein